MVSYTVVCPKELDDALLNQWLRSDSLDRQILTKASYTIQRWLRHIPLHLGQPLPSEPTMRVWAFSIMAKTVAVEYQVFEEDRTVIILRIKLRSE